MTDAKKRDKELIEENPLNRQLKNEEEIKKRTFKEKLIHIKRNATVEPLLGGLIIPSVLSRFAMGNLNLDKACRVNLDFGDEVCSSLVKKTNANYSSYEKQVQALIASIDIWKSVIHTAIPCIIIMFLGAWSDRTGKRKICILLPIFGELLASISNLLNVYYFNEIPVEVTVFLETFLTAITGGWVTMFLGVFSYISDITSEESRTFRVGLVNFCMTTGVPIGVGLSGILLSTIGYYGVFSITSTMFVVVLTYGIIVLKEPDKMLKELGLPPIERKDSSGVSFFDTTHVMETIAVAYKPRPSNKRLRVIFTLVTVFILCGPAVSEYGIIYLFVRNRLNWDMVQYGLYTSYSILLHSFGAMFSISVLSKRFQVDDALLCIISMTSKFVGLIWTAFVQSDIEMYLVPVAEILNATTITSLRSIASKLVEKQENAKVNSLFSLTEMIAALLFQPFHSWLYMKTLYLFSGTVFVVCGIFVIPAIIIVLTFYVQNKKAQKKSRKHALEAEVKKEEEAKKRPITFCPVDTVKVDSVVGIIENKFQKSNAPIDTEEIKNVKKET